MWQCLHLDKGVDGPPVALLYDLFASNSFEGFVILKSKSWWFATAQGGKRIRAWSSPLIMAPIVPRPTARLFLKHPKCQGGSIRHEITRDHPGKVADFVPVEGPCFG